jgi:arylsulfatase A-like enzyme
VFWLFLPPLIQQILMTDPGNHALTILALAAAVVGAAAAVGAVYAVVAHLWGRPPAPSPRLVLSKTCVVTALAALFLCALFLRLPDAAKRDAAHPDVILVSLDTLRADSVGCYGATPSPTPSVDALAQQATRYARTYAPSPWTIPSHAGLLTGLANERHGATRMDSRLPKRLTTLAEWFAQAGYRTAGFVNSFLLSPRYGFGQGFRTYDMLPERPGQHVMDRAVAWLDRQAGAPVFLFVHLFDAHWPYGAPDDALPGGHAKSFHEFVDQALPLDEPARSRWRARYADDVRLADASLGALVQHLRASRRYDDAWVIVTSDHGEEFWEHGFLGHAVTLYDEVLRVPLVVKAPRQADAAVVDQSVSLLDAPATLLAQALRRQPNDMDGKPLPPATGAPHDIAASSHLWGGPRFALIRGCVKGITAYTWRFGAYGGAVPPQAFDVCADPTESVNRHGADEARTLETDLARQSGIVPPGNAEAATLSEAERARLKALGYIP